MTYVDENHASQSSVGYSETFYDRMNKMTRDLINVGRMGLAAYGDPDTSVSDMSELQKSLRDVQYSLSSISMYLPEGMSNRLSHTFAKLLNEDAWEDEDILPSKRTINTFLNVLVSTDTKRTPGVGTNGRGSITAFWISNGNRLTIDCHPCDKTTWVLTRQTDDQPERAAGECLSSRLLQVLAPYNPEMWFDQ